MTSAVGRARVVDGRKEEMNSGTGIEARLKQYCGAGEQAMRYEVVTRAVGQGRGRGEDGGEPGKPSGQSESKRYFSFFICFLGSLIHRMKSGR